MPMLAAAASRCAEAAALVDALMQTAAADRIRGPRVLGPLGAGPRGAPRRSGRPIGQRPTRVDFFTMGAGRGLYAGGRTFSGSVHR